MVIVLFKKEISDSLIFYYYLFLYGILTFWFYNIWYFRFGVWLKNRLWRNSEHINFGFKIVVSIVFIVASLVSFVGLSALIMFIPVPKLAYQLEYKCKDYDIVSKSKSVLTQLKDYYAIKNETVVRLYNKNSTAKNCDGEITLKIIDGKNVKNDYLYTSPFATQAEIANTPEVKSILDSNPNARITEYEQGSSVTIAIK